MNTKLPVSAIAIHASDNNGGEVNAAATRVTDASEVTEGPGQDAHTGAEGEKGEEKVQDGVERQDDGPVRRPVLIRTRV